MTPTRITLITKVCCFKSNWYEWSCEAEMPDGRIVAGWVQADRWGEMIAKDTFEAEAEA